MSSIVMGTDRDLVARVARPRPTGAWSGVLEVLDEPPVAPEPVFVVGCGVVAEDTADELHVS